MHELNIPSPVSLARFSLTLQLIYKNTKLKNEILVLVSDTSKARNLHLPGERTF